MTWTQSTWLGLVDVGVRVGRTGGDTAIEYVFQPATLAEHISEDRLSPREIEVLQLVSAGKRNKEIAASRSLAEGTINMDLRDVRPKMGARDRTEAVRVARRRGIIRR
jgi:DNA-binding NarL/FixJ family response regulator